MISLAFGPERRRLLRTVSTACAAATILIGLQAAPARAQDFGGIVGGYCAIDGDWVQVSQSGGAAGGEFSGGVWRIPENGFVDSQSQPLDGQPRTIRLGASASCNAPHRISLTSDGGLRLSSGTAAPAGFSAVRPMRYVAHWTTLDAGVSGDAPPHGPELVVVTTNGNHDEQEYLVDSHGVPGDDKRFDLELGFAPGAGGDRLLAGTYTDTVTVTISPLS